MSESCASRLASVLCTAFFLATSLYATPAASPRLWLRADAGVTSSAGKVSVWADQSGFGTNATMTLASRQPSIVTGALNGQPVIRFGGAQSLYLTGPVSPTSFSVFIVGKNSKPTETFSMILGPGGNYPNNQLRWENGSQALFVGTGNNLPITISTIGNTRVYHELSATYNGSVMKVYRDGTLISSHSFATSGPWTLSNVGAYYSSYFMTGDLAEVLIYTRVLTDAERVETDCYLSGKYGLPSSGCAVQLVPVSSPKYRLPPCTTCPPPPPGPVCGNGLCESGESCSSCSSDCGPCSTCNHNGTCDYNENSSTCSDCCSEGPAQAKGDETSYIAPCS